MPITATARACQSALDHLRDGVPVLTVLAELAHSAEALSGDGAVASIMVLDAEGRLRNAAAPSLPADYLAAIDGIRPDPEVGTCAAAAATGMEVVTRSFTDCGKWRELHHLPFALGLLGAWSLPIRSLVDGRVLGTFGTYFRDVREPTDAERAAVRELATVAARALEDFDYAAAFADANDASRVHAGADKARAS